MILRWRKYYLFSWQGLLITYIHLIKDYYIHFSEKKYFIWFNSVSGIGLIYVYISLWCSVWLAGGWC